MTTGIGPASGPYKVPSAGPVVGGILETEITAALAPIVSGTTTMTNAETFT